MKAISILVFFILIMLPILGIVPGMQAIAGQGAQLDLIDNDGIILGHISDEHIGFAAPESIEYERLKDALRTIKRLNADLLISTGDVTNDNLPYSYQMYNQAFAEVKGFSLYPSYGAGIPFRPVAGNHDYYGIAPWLNYMGPTQQSFIIGDYQFIGFSGDPSKDLPEAWLESEMQKACRDGKYIILYHHYPPHGWMPPDLDMSEASWAKIDALARKYPVIAYLAGHIHGENTQVMAPEYLVHTAGRLGAGYYTIYSLSGGTINMNNTRGNVMAPLIITYPAEYHEGLDYTKTEAKQTKVRAYVRTDEGQISQVSYKLDGGAAVIMQRVGATDYYEANLNASYLSGRHTITVAANHSYGAWASSTHQIISYFAPSVPKRAAPGCACVQSSISIPLVAGWNLVSVPFMPDSSMPADVLAPIAGHYSAVYAYDTAGGNIWRRYAPDVPSALNNLTTIDERQGWWIQATDNITLTVTGEIAPSTMIPLVQGWNLVGYPKQRAEDIATALASIEGKYEIVYMYDASTPGNPWRSYDASNPLAPGGLRQMEPGKGYWIYVTSACTWAVE